MLKRRKKLGKMIVRLIIGIHHTIFKIHIMSG